MQRPAAETGFAPTEALAEAGAAKKALARGRALDKGEMMASGSRERVDRLTEAFLPMNRLDLAELRRAYRGG